MEHEGPSPAVALTRRQILALAATGVGAAAAGGSIPVSASRAPSMSPTTVPATSAATPLIGPYSTTPWTGLCGAAHDKPSWASVQRGGRFFNSYGKVKVEKLRQHLQTHDLVSWAAPTQSVRTWEGFDNFMSSVHDSGGQWWRKKTRIWVSGLINTHAETPHKVLALSTGNEINSQRLDDKFHLWAATRGLPFPHPRSNYGDGSMLHSRDHIGYYVEYMLAPAVEGTRLANALVPPEDRIPILLGTMVGARHPALRDSFLPALAEYVIEGTFAPTLAGLRVADVVDYIGLHYLLTPEVIFGYADEDGAPLPYGHRLALDDLHNRWVGNGTIRGVWLTEEGGNATQKLDRHGSVALRVFARAAEWALTRGVSVDQFRSVGYYIGPPNGFPTYDPRPETSWKFAMSVLQGFVGDDVPLINRSGGVAAWVVGNEPTETYGFETADHTRRVLFVTPQSIRFQGATTVTAMSMLIDGWAAEGDPTVALAHLFKSDAEGYKTFDVTVVRSDATGRYELLFPEPVSLNANADMQTLMIHVQHG